MMQEPDSRPRATSRSRPRWDSTSSEAYQKPFPINRINESIETPFVRLALDSKNVVDLDILVHTTLPFRDGSAASASAHQESRGHTTVRVIVLIMKPPNSAAG